MKKTMYLTPQKRENSKTFVEMRQIDSEMVATTTTPVIFSDKRSHQIVTKNIIMQFKSDPSSLPLLFNIITASLCCLFSPSRGITCVPANHSASNQQYVERQTHLYAARRFLEEHERVSDYVN